MSGMSPRSINQALTSTPKQIVNRISASPFAQAPLLTPVGKVITAGAMTANVLTPIISVTGQGVIDYLAVFAADATARTMRLQLVLDGNVVMDTTSNGGGASYGGVMVGGPNNNIGGGYGTSYQSVPFRSSFVLNIASSLTETGGLKADVIYSTN